MATQKMIDTLVMLDGKVRTMQGTPPLTTAEREALAAKIAPLPLKKVQELFDKVNVILDFDRHTSPATLAQRKRISQLEIAAYGKARTTWQDAMSFQQASDLLTALVAMRAAATEAVKDLEKLANTPAPALSPLFDR